MATKFLIEDSGDSTGRASVAATMAGGDTVVLPSSHNKVWFAIPSMSSGTITPKLSLGATFSPILRDLDGITYPRASFTGGVFGFLVPPGSGVKLAATASSINVKSSE